MSKFKPLYIFEVLTPRETEEKTVQMEDGQEVTRTVKVKKDVPRRVALKKPTRNLLDDAELYYNVLVSQGIQSGLMSRALLAKRFSNDGGVLSDDDKKNYANAFWELEQKQQEFGRLTLKDDAVRTETEKVEFEKLVKDIGLLRRQLQDLEMQQLSLYDITAESRARTKTVLWWTLFLTYVEVEGKTDEWEPVFKGANFEEKMDQYDVIEEGDSLSSEQREFYFKAIRRAAASAAFWFYGQASKQEDFESLEQEIARETPTKSPIAPRVPVEDKPTE